MCQISAYFITEPGSSLPVASGPVFDFLKQDSRASPIEDLKLDTTKLRGPVAVFEADLRVKIGEGIFTVLNPSALRLKVTLIRKDTIELLGAF